MADRPRRSRTLSAVQVLLVVLGAVGYTAGLVELHLWTLRSLRPVGGFCASAGPSVVAHGCPAGSPAQIGLGIAGVLVFGGVLMFTLGWMQGPAIEAALVMWVVGFALIGLDFVTVNPNAGLIAGGAALELVAVLGAVPLVSAIRDNHRDAGMPSPEPLVLGEIVRAARRR